ncbi:MAG: BspA family leucine-rich repeat surface protein [Cytophagales bacterium]|nr:BspA family leucine-rich repeat surface protein [Cytophagales bacterium]
MRGVSSKLICYLLMFIGVVNQLSAQSEFITVWKTDNPGISAENQVFINTIGEGYDFTIDWGDGEVEHNRNGDVSHTYDAKGIYTIKISGGFPRIFFNYISDQKKILEVQQWGDIAWSSMEEGFRGCTNLRVSATDAPDLSRVTSMKKMFDGATVFNDPINHWDVSNVTDMEELFRRATNFNQNISDWDVSSVVNFAFAFSEASSFNQPLNNWDMSSAEILEWMFHRAASFNQPLRDWDLSNAKNINFLFQEANHFNQDVSTWNVSSVESMQDLFSLASAFNQSLGDWDISNVTEIDAIFNGTSISQINYDATLIGWGNLTTPPSGINLSVSNLPFCAGSTARQRLIDNFSWIINGDVQACLTPSAFVSTWNTQIAGISGSNQITIPTTGSGYNYSVDWGDGMMDTGVTGDITHTYAEAGKYVVTITGDFPRIFFNGSGDRNKLLFVNQWGDITWESMSNAFKGCENLKVFAVDAPDLSLVTDMSGMFYDCRSFNQPIGHWNVSQIEKMGELFRGATSFNQPLEAWNVGRVSDMSYLFYQTIRFDQPLNNWDVSSVQTMSNMFNRAWDFDQPLNNWITSSLTDLSWTFANTRTFNQPLSNWDVSRVTDFEAAFSSSHAFNQALEKWDVSSGNFFLRMFSNSLQFNQALGNWDISNAESMVFMFTNSVISVENYDETITGWSALTIPPNSILFDNIEVTYCESESARQSLINEHAWTFFNDEKLCLDQVSTVAFVTKWKTNNPGASAADQITIPASSGGFNFNVDWGDGSTDESITNTITHTYDQPGIYEVIITGIFPRILFNNEGDKDKIIDIMQWGDQKWTSMKNAFYGCTQLNISATDAPDLSGVIDLTRMFSGATSFNSDINHWDVSFVKTIHRLFEGAIEYNQPLHDWDVSNVEDMSYAFKSAYRFNQALNDWDVSNVATMRSMFDFAFDFNQPLNGWDVSRVTDFGGIFEVAVSLDQSFEGWDISSAVASAFSTDFSFLSLSYSNYDATLRAWSALDNVPENLKVSRFGFYCDSESAKNTLVNDHGWNISDFGQKCIWVSQDRVNIAENEVQGYRPLKLDVIYAGELELSFTLGGTLAAAFSVNPVTQELVLEQPDLLDSHAETTGSVIVTVSDGEINDSGWITVSVIPEVEPGFVLSPANLFAKENQESQYTLDIDGYTSSELSYSLSGPDVSFFEINGLTGELSFSVQDFENPLDADQDNNYEIVVAARDLYNTRSHEVTVSVTDANEAPSFEISAMQLTSENESSLALQAFDPENDDLTYTVIDGVDLEYFSIDASSGKLSFSELPNFESPADTDGDNIYEVEVQASDGTFHVTQAFSIEVTDVDEAPVFSSNTVFEMIENLNNVISLSAADPEGSDVTFSIYAGADLDFFLVDPATGELSFTFSPDFEVPIDEDEDNAYEVVLHASDGSNTSTQSLSITIIDENESPSISSNLTASINENTTAVTTVTANDPESNSLTYSLSGGFDESQFEIDGSTGVLMFKNAPDFENPVDENMDNIYELEVGISDGTNAINQPLSIMIIDENESPSITSNSTASINENTTAVTTVTANDPESNSLTYSLSGGFDESQFEIDGSTGVLMFKNAPDFENPVDENMDNIYELEVGISDGTNAINQPLSIMIIDENESPSITSNSTASINENTTAVTTVTATDPESNSLTYSLSGGFDESQFEIDGSTGVLMFKNAPDFENPVDENMDNIYELEVGISDGTNAINQPLSIMVVDENESPSITSNSTASINENTTAVTTVTATDPESNSLTYSLSGGFDESQFEIDGSTGVLMFKNAPDFENPVDENMDNIYELEVGISDGSNAINQPLSIMIIDENESPSITSNSTASIIENTTAVTTVTANDPESNSLTFSLSGGFDESQFEIDGSTGVLMFKNAPDFENPVDENMDNIYELEVGISDGTNTINQRLSIMVVDENESPSITSNSTASIIENTTAVTTVTANDPESNSLTFSLSGSSDESQFEIDGSTGVLMFKNAPDFENPGDEDMDNIYELEVGISDGTNTINQPLSIMVVDENESPSITSNSTASIIENTTAVTTVTATDPESNSLTYSLSGGFDESQFEIDGSTGVLMFKNAPDFENPVDENMDNIYELEVGISDGTNAINQPLSIMVVDENESPSITSNSTASIIENTTAVTTVTATDPESNSLTYSLSGGSDESQFEIDGSTGVLIFKNAPDFENPGDEDMDNEFELIINVSDGELSDQLELSITVTDELETITSVEHEHIELNVFPNPVSEILTINTPERALSNVRLQVVDLSGKKLLEVFDSVGIYVGDLENGTYLLKIDGVQLNEIIRFIKVD